MNGTDFNHDNSSLGSSLPFPGNQSQDHQAPARAKFKPSEAIASNEVKDGFEYGITFLLCFIIGTTGIVNNILIMIVFIKQGFQETINISLTCMSIWDLIKCIAFVAFCVYVPISDYSEGMSWSWLNICGASVIYIFFFAGYVSSAIAAYVAVERCLCVCMPFTVKFLLTSKITTIVNVILSVCVFAACAIKYNQTIIAWLFQPQFNMTLAERKTSPNYIDEITVYYNTISAVLPLLFFIVIAISTTLIFYQLVKASKFRAMSAAADKKDKSNQLSLRDRRVIKMLLVILSLYLATNLPRLARYFAKMIVPEFKYRGYYNNIFYVITYLMYAFDLINAAVNIFIFYSMSQQFKTTFRSLFGYIIRMRKSSN